MNLEFHSGCDIGRVPRLDVDKTMTHSNMTGIVHFDRNLAGRRKHGSAKSALWLSIVLMLALSCVRLAHAESPETDEAAITETPITATDRDHWAFQPLQRPDIPSVNDRDWCRNPVDRFILAKLEAASLRPMPEADLLVLLRRVTFDLTGLPPTRDEIERFTADRAPGAYERAVDRLLVSPAYGERWAQHWLDLARFAETDGFEHDHVRGKAWTYRDWVINALNRDLPYDQFVRLQLGADSWVVAGMDDRHALGFLLAGPDMPDINSQDERRHTFLNDLTSTVGSIFFGLQVGCAQCHDHKFDPISQADFYRLRACFDPSLAFKRNKRAELSYASRGTPDSRLMIRGDFRRPGPEIGPGVPRISTYDADVIRTGSEKKLSYRAQLANLMTAADHPQVTRVMVNRLWQHHFGRGISREPSDFGIMGQEPTHPELLDWLAGELPRMEWSLKRMHRLLVTSATYRQVSKPTSLQWSDEERQTALQRWKQNTTDDPDNDLFGRMNRRRLEGEAIRDAMLAAADRLNRKAGGPGFRPPLPKEMLATLLKNQWPVTKEVAEHDRRSIYLFVRRNLRYPIFAVFDKPDTNQSCPRRGRSTIAPQALTLLNSKLSLELARSLATVLIDEFGDDRRAWIENGYTRTLGRRPTADELDSVEKFLRDNESKLRMNNRSRDRLAIPKDLKDDIDPYAAAALTDFCLVLFNLNEFIYVD